MNLLVIYSIPFLIYSAIKKVSNKMIYLKPDKKSIHSLIFILIVTSLPYIGFLIIAATIDGVDWKERIAIIAVALFFIIIIYLWYVYELMKTIEWFEFYEESIVVKNFLGVKNIVYIKDIVDIKEERLSYLFKDLEQDFYMLIDNRPMGNEFDHISLTNNKKYCVRIYKCDLSIEMVNKIMDTINQKQSAGES